MLLSSFGLPGPLTASPSGADPRARRSSAGSPVFQGQAVFCRVSCVAGPGGLMQGVLCCRARRSSARCPVFQGWPGGLPQGVLCFRARRSSAGCPVFQGQAVFNRVSCVSEPGGLPQGVLCFRDRRSSAGCPVFQGQAVFRRVSCVSGPSGLPQGVLCFRARRSSAECPGAGSACLWSGVAGPHSKPFSLFLSAQRFLNLLKDKLDSAFYYFYHFSFYFLMMFCL